MAKTFKKCPYCPNREKNYGVYECEVCENGGCYQLGVTENVGCWGSKLKGEDEYMCPYCIDAGDEDGGTVKKLGVIWN
jgi:hypothetical protein